jgi:hypothetical protein
VVPAHVASTWLSLRDLLSMGGRGPWRAGASTREKTGPNTVWRCWRLRPSTTLSLLGTTWCTRTGRPASGGRAARCHRCWPVNGVRRLTVSSTPLLGSEPRPSVWRPSASRSRALTSPTRRSSAPARKPDVADFDWAGGRRRARPSRPLGDLRDCACLRQCPSRICFPRKTFAVPSRSASGAFGLEEAA